MEDNGVRRNMEDVIAYNLRRTEPSFLIDSTLASLSHGTAYKSYVLEGREQRGRARPLA